MRNNNKRARAAFMKFVAVPLVAVVVGGCGADPSETGTRAGDQVEVLELEVENDQYAALDLGQAGVSVGDMAVTGGTGAYRGARGTVRFWDIATPSERVRAEIIR